MKKVSLQSKNSESSSRSSNSVEEEKPTTSNNLQSNDEAIVARPKPPFPGFGIFCGVMAGLVYAFNTFLVKFVQSTKAFQLSASRCIVQTLILVPYITYNWKRHSIDIIGSPATLKFLLLRGTTGSLGSILLYQSIQRLPVGDAVTLLFTSIVFAAVIAFFCLKEPLGVVDCFMILLTLAGVALISKPTIIFGGASEDDREVGELVLGVAIGIAGALLNAITMVVLRKLGKQKVAPSLNILYYSLIGSFASIIMVLASGSYQAPCLHEVPFISLLGVTGITGQIFLTLGLQYERTAVFPAIRSLQIVFVYILQITILHDQPSLLSGIGAACIFGSVIGFCTKKLYNSVKAEKKS